MVEPQHETHQHAQANGSIDVEMNGSTVAADGSSTDSTDGGADTTTATADLNGNVSPSANKSLQVALAELVSKEVAQYAPLLIGKYYVQDKRAVWAGRWGMTEAAFGPSGVTSAFEMKSDEDVYVRTCASEDPSTVHPVFADGFLAKSSRVENPDASSIHPGYIGYERDPAERSAMPFDCKYSGFFQIQAVKGKPQTVTEKSVEIRFVHNASRPSHFYVSGLGENKFGVFNLVGLLDKETSEMRLYKIYKPKEKEKRTPLPKRTRAAAAKPPVPAASTVVKLPVAAAPPPPPPAPVAVPSQTLPPLPKMPALSVARPSVSTPMGSDTSTAPSPFTVSRGRSERKIIQPARLRDENILDHDQTPTSLKKCHAILKSLMANPKAGPFLVPVDPVALGIPDYFNVIKEPMDLGTIRQNLEGGYYTDAYVFIDHVRLVFDNARLYNAAHSQVHIYAAKLSEDFEKRIKNLSTKTSKDKSVERVFGSGTPTTSIIKLKRDRKGEPTHSTKKIKGGRGAKGNSKRAISEGNEGLIMSLKEDIERLKATLEQLQPNAVRTITPKPSKGAARPFKMEDLTEEELNEPMTQAEKARLSEDIRQLPQDKINRVLQIIAESVPVSKLTNENDEVEIDINSFDSRCLRMLEGYVRENGIGRKRKRPTAKSSKSAPVSHRLKSAKVAAVHIRERKEHVKHQLARMDGNGATEAAKAGVPAYTADVDMDKADQDNSSSDSSSDSSDSSDSDSDSDSESDSDAGAPLQRSPTLTGGSTLSQLSETARAEAAKKIRDEASTREPLKVENRGAWSLLAQKETNSQSLMLPEENQTSSLWMSARSMEQIKQQKIQQKERERTDEIEAQRRREVEQREKEKEREREELERRKKEQDAALHQARQEQLREERVRQAERAHVAERVSEREKVVEDDEFGESHDLTEDLESFSSSSFL